MHTESPKKVKKAKLMQRRIKAERHTLIFVAIWRDHAPNHRSCRYLAWTRSSGPSQAAPGEHILSLFCVITLILKIYDFTMIADVVAILRDHAMFGETPCSTSIRFCRYFAWARSFVATLLTRVISYWRFATKQGRQILSLFCVITLSVIISQ